MSSSPPPPYPATESRTRTSASPDDIQAMADAMLRSSISPNPRSASSTATTIAAPTPESTGKKSSLGFSSFRSESTSSRTRERLRLAELQLERNNAIIERMKREAGGAGIITPREAQRRVSQLKREIKAEGEAAPKRSSAGMFSSTCSTDLLFLIDTTGSMCAYIAAATEQVKNIVDNIEETFLNEAVVRMAVVGYKDHGDSPNIQFLDFTSSADAVRNFLDTLVASGGNDTPEDVLGGIRQALNASWTQQNRCIIHIADAPPHGRNQHAENLDDQYPKPGSEPHKLTYEPLIKQMIKLNINYALLRILNLTDRMSFNFLKLYAAAGGDCKLHNANMYYPMAVATCDEARTKGRGTSGRSAIGGLLFEEKELGTEYDALKHLVVRVVMNSASRTAVRMSSSSSRTGSTKPNKQMKSFLGSIQEDEDAGDDSVRLETNPPRWGKQGWLNETLIMEGFCPDVVVHNASTLDGMLANDDNIKLSIMELAIHKRSKPFAQGAMRTASYAQTAASSNRFVVKAFKRGGKKLAHLAEDMRCQALCKAFALEFNALTGDEHSSIDFIVTTCLKGRRGDDCLSLEPFIDGNYVKYNNNCGYVNEDNPNNPYNLAAQAFSHFTFERSKGQFLVSDLQGVGGLLTDPVIHTADKDRFVITDTNLNREGFKFFFSTHKCNDICKKLELKSTASMLRSGAYEFRTSWPSMDNTVCCSNKLCGKIVQLAKANKSNNYPDCHWCDGCWPQLTSSKKLCMAQGAHHEFRASDFFYESQGRNTPRLCEEHRASEYDEKDHDVYPDLGAFEFEDETPMSSPMSEYRDPEKDAAKAVEVRRTERMRASRRDAAASASRNSTVSSTTAGCSSIWARLRFAKRRSGSGHSR